MPCLHEYSCNIQKNTYCQNPNPTSIQPNITSVGFDNKMTLHHHPPPPPTTLKNSMSAIYQLLLAHFDQTLKIVYWDHLEQISTVMAIFVEAIFVLAIFVHIRNISADTDPQILKVGFWDPL